MRRLMFAAAALACACTPASNDAPAVEGASEEPRLEAVSLPMSDQAGNRMEALTQSGGGERWCTVDGVWCVGALDDSSLAVTRGNQHMGSVAITDVPEGDSWGVWPQIVRLGRNDDSALVGVTRTTHQMYSGGGGEATHVGLYEVIGGTLREALRMPQSGSATIRACFDEDDERQRAGACADLYTFVSRASLDETVASGPPRIVLETAAGSYPGRVTRNADSLENAPLRSSDLVWANDETCSYRRVFTRNANGLYEPDQTLPECTDYLNP